MLNIQIGCYTADAEEGLQSQGSKAFEGQASNVEMMQDPRRKDYCEEPSLREDHTARIGSRPAEDRESTEEEQEPEESTALISSEDKKTSDVSDYR